MGRCLSRPARWASGDYSVDIDNPSSAMVVNAFGRHVDVYEFETSLVYIVNSRQAKGT